MNRSLSRRQARNIDCSGLNRYWTDPAYRQQCDNETNHARRLINDEMDAAMVANGTRWPVDWSDADKAEMTAKIEGKI
jgi:hypothetical protein